MFPQFTTQARHVERFSALHRSCKISACIYDLLLLCFLTVLTEKCCCCAGWWPTDGDRDCVYLLANHCWLLNFFIYTVMAFSRRFRRKQFTVIHTYLRWCANQHIRSRMGFSRTVWHADQGNRTSNLLITGCWFYPRATITFSISVNYHLVSTVLATGVSMQHYIIHVSSLSPCVLVRLFSWI